MAEEKTYSRVYYILNEVLNSVTHGISFILAVIGTVFLVYKGWKLGQGGIAIVSYLIFGISMCLLYLSSTLYHSLYFTKARKVFRAIDHSSIYLFIAGTYTPFCLVSLRDSVGIMVCILIWLIAIIGIVLKCVSFEKVKKISTVLYLIMGWLAIFTAKPLYEAIGKKGVSWLLAGGITYSLGTIFYSLKNIKFMHVIWHLFVTMGSVCMWISIYFFVAN